MNDTDAPGGALCGPATKEATRRPNGHPRWCYHCRTRRTFHFVTRVPDPSSYYGPTPSVECATCGTRDGDMFPGRYREWE
jgi:hypothetical protein